MHCQMSPAALLIYSEHKRQNSADTKFMKDAYLAMNDIRLTCMEGVL